MTDSPQSFRSRATVAIELLKRTRTEWVTRKALAKELGVKVETVTHWVAEFVDNGVLVERMGRGAGWRVKQNESFSEAISGQLVDTRNPRSVWTIPTHGFKGAHFATFPPALAERCITAGCPVGGTVLDPFGGSGTVGLVSDRQHKDAILIDLDERNVPMATDRISGDSPLFAEVLT